VLVVEDDPDAAATLQQMLELWGYEPQVAPTGPAALTIARDYHPEVVLCDIGLPGMDGYQVAAELRRDPATASALLIALTGYGRAEDRSLGETAGFDHYLVKPVSPDALLELLAGVRYRASA
jgi:CheY-like chemotaxis protein